MTLHELFKLYPTKQHLQLKDKYNGNVALINKNLSGTFIELQSNYSYLISKRTYYFDVNYDGWVLMKPLIKTVLPLP